MDLFAIKKIEKELCLELTNDQAGKLIGNGGKTIKDIRKRFSDTTININRNGQRIVRISGKRKVNVYGLILTQIM